MSTVTSGRGGGSLHFHSKDPAQTLHQLLLLHKHLYIELIKLNYSHDVSLSGRLAPCVSHKMNSVSQYPAYLTGQGTQRQLPFSVTGAPEDRSPLGEGTKDWGVA